MNNSIAEKLECIARNEQFIYNAGVEKGKAEAEKDGYNQGYADGIEQGKQTENNGFWDSYIFKEPMTDSAGLFAGRGWNDKSFKPNKSFTISGSSAYIFYNTGITDFVGLLERLGVTITFSDISGNVITSYSALTTFPPISFRAALTNAFANSANLVTVEKVILKEDGSNTFSSPFNNCPELKNITFEGVIGQNGLNIQSSTKLSSESIESVINALSTTTSGLTVTISKTAKENAFTDEEWASLIATKPNWTISLA